MSESRIAPATIDELKQVIASESCVLAVGNRTKPPLSDCPDATLVSLNSITGMIEYEPSEFTFTTRAGTLVCEIEAALAEKNQYLPFDPMLTDAGATIGGTVAAGLSGPGRFRYGGIRDFLLGVRFFSGEGKKIHAGGKVVKNAAGFDIPKFLVGSMGRFGVMTELTFKVFPRPVAMRTLCVVCSSHRQAADRMAMAASSRWELYAIDYRPDSQSMFLKLGGPPGALDAIAAEIRSQWGQDASDLDEADSFWKATRELNWSSYEAAVKVPTTLTQMVSLFEAVSDDDGLKLHGSVAGGVVWILFDGDKRRLALDSLLQSLEAPGLVVRGRCESPQLGRWTSNHMQQSIKAAMDPLSKFPSLVCDQPAQLPT